MGTSPELGSDPNSAAESEKKDISYPHFGDVGRGLVELLKHVICLVAILSSIRFLQWFMTKLWGTEDIVFFEVVKLKYVFQASHMFLLFGFLGAGTWKLIKALNGGK